MADSTVTLDFNAARGWGPEADTTGVSIADAELIANLQQGLETAYEALIERFEQPVYNLVVRMVGNSADAEDVVQEVFLKVFRNVAAFRRQSSLKTWIYRIAVNEARNHRRWFSRHAGREVGLGAEPEAGRTYEQVLEDACPSPYQSAADRESRRLIERALSRLKPAYRAAVVLRDLEELSYEEIAEVLQISLGTVKSRIVRGREGLRRSLEGLTEDSAGGAVAAESGDAMTLGRAAV